MKRINKTICLVAILSFVLNPTSTWAMTKDETIYTTIKSNEDLYKVTVVNHLYGTTEEEIEDVTELKDILNINGKETFTMNGKNITWKNQGKEIFYQGNIEKELPIQTEVKYYLDGKEMQSKDMIGKKGKIKIIIHLKNNDSHEIDINGHNETLYTPFVVTAGTILSGKNNSNLEVSNGKVVNTGSKNMVVSLATPGLYDSLGLEQFKDMDTITIRYDTTSYKENTIYLVATPKLIDSTDLEVFHKLDKAYNDVDSLQTNMNTIEKGAISLEEGAKGLANGSKEISDNLFKIVSYMRELESGSLELENGFNQLMEALNHANNELQNGDSEGSIASLNQLKGGNQSAIEKLTTTNHTIKGLFLNNGIDIDMVSVDVLPDDLVTYKQTYDANNSLIQLLLLNNQAIDQTIATTTATSQTIHSLFIQLQDSFNQLATGANTLYSSINQIRNGIEQLYHGSLTLKEGANTLYSGTTTLRNGISTYNKEGIQQLSSYAIKTKVYTNKLESLIRLSNDYKGFASDNTDSTTFVSVIK